MELPLANLNFTKLDEGALKYCLEIVHQEPQAVFFCTFPLLKCK